MISGHIKEEHGWVNLYLVNCPPAVLSCIWGEGYNRQTFKAIDIETGKIHNGYAYEFKKKQNHYIIISVYKDCIDDLIKNYNILIHNSIDEMLIFDKLLNG